MVNCDTDGDSEGITLTIAQYWDQRSSSFDEDIHHVSESAEETAAWKDILSGLIRGRQRLTILDVGTGTGFMAFLLAEMGHQVVGIDISAGMLLKAREKALNSGLPASFKEANAEHTGFPGQTFDLVISRHLIWNLPHPDAAIAEWARVSKPGGIVSVINGIFSANLERWDEPFRAAFDNLPLAGGAAPETVATLMERHGLAPVWTEWLNALAEVKRRTLPEDPSYGSNKRYLVAGTKPGLTSGKD